MTSATVNQHGVSLNVGLEGNFERIDFNRRPVRKAMNNIGRAVRFRARRLAARRALSRPGDYPGVDSGELVRAINFKVSRAGFLVLIQPDKTSGMKEFYPAFLFYGAERRRRGGDLAARGNYMIDAMQMKRPFIERELYAALVKGLKE